MTDAARLNYQSSQRRDSGGSETLPRSAEHAPLMEVLVPFDATVPEVANLPPNTRLHFHG
jgi:hypothetical protein